MVDKGGIKIWLIKDKITSDTVRNGAFLFIHFWVRWPITILPLLLLPLTFILKLEYNLIPMNRLSTESASLINVLKIFKGCFEWWRKLFMNKIWWHCTFVPVFRKAVTRIVLGQLVALILTCRLGYSTLHLILTCRLGYSTLHLILTCRLVYVLYSTPDTHL